MAVSFVERAVVFDRGEERLVGVVAEPAAARRLGVLVVVGGPQYRAGSHRQFVLLARRLAAEGYAVMRFDCHGMGDSTGPMQSFEEAGPDIDAAIGTLLDAGAGAEKVVLWGLCDAAAGALAYWHATRDPRVAGMVLLNPWVRSRVGHARTQIRHYYRQRVLDAAFWKKLLGGGVDVGEAARGFVRAARTMLAGARRDASGSEALSFQDRMAEGLRTFSRPVLLVLSGRDLTAREFLDYARSHRRWEGLLERSNVRQVEVADADHTVSSAPWRTEVENLTLAWLGELDRSAAR